MSIPNIKKVLVIGMKPWVNKLIEELAKHNPTVQYDLLTTFEIRNINLPNVNIILMDLYYNVPFSRVTADNLETIAEESHQGAWIGYSFWLKKFLDNHINNYDFVVAPTLFTDSMSWVQNYRSKRPIFCVSDTAGVLERDKLFTKQMLLDLDIPTPKFKLLDINTILSNTDELGKAGFPLVIKTNVMAGALGTWVFTDTIDPLDIQIMLDKIKQTDDVTNAKIYSEDFIGGQEVSAHFLCNGTTWEYIGSARDYKRNYDGDVGPNTLGTGCYSPVDYFTDDVKNQTFGYMDQIMHYLNSVGISYNGIMYLGIMIDDKNIPHVLEINTRPGTPEFLTILDTIDTTNLLENLYRASTGLDLLKITPINRSAVAVGLLNREYPRLSKHPRFHSVKPIIPNIPDDVSFYNHFTIFVDQNVYGFVTATDSTRERAGDKIYKFLNTVETNDFRYRTDIGFLE
jgi:phosphoribosylamine--glycine ligase